ncbi:UDP-N-acetylglucosamine--N-acetylmuramyl-(pentapeptide) pyrophosphoryl-undecaprenol N-acetylglucosamine transferase [Patescibacteria group bacterium]|nr:UDP-N-acetylglucosamine--N-acetylmuramyl-(pentapeptide) pyrophosphoryl-undecaprenol N-acetylglucosamine transferase [Patescibacteria group bacterium]MBU1721624.1 UDP-N-acetylglucosamine--N-acetylmuramyl-(pentapeptide) pyrophosphoryl-undecaprenol N-acetylglucosamine transferase [Patescibacteria group bacterium]MBU1901714.1 UDP-N-acetylglucosamine--N-acetylmuramyl-(pentapeptide) pyrophosphoryl-undecaprenol N-acetylglucosamine transferase [Patescibacteria group bacterium]
MKIIFSGGGTLGPVTPLLAIVDIAKTHYQAEVLWVGTIRGPERSLIEEKGIPFVTLSSGKFRRYLSFWNVIDITRIFIGFFQAVRLLWKEQPDMCVSAGGFISVPLHWAAFVLGIPTWIHQQDVRPGLANKLMAPTAHIITTALEQSTLFFSKRKTYWLGNPVRSEILAGSAIRAKELFKLALDIPVIFVTGGGTGSMRVNQMITQALTHLDGYVQVLHLTGKERPQELIAPANRQFSFYHPYQFFTYEMSHAYAIADIVISRGGFGTLTEIAALGKPAIIIPKPGHQDDNVSFLEQAGAIYLLDEELNDGNHLAKKIRELLVDKPQQAYMRQKIQTILPVAPVEKIVGIIDRLVK